MTFCAPPRRGPRHPHLTELGATIGQGYLLSRPLPAHDAVELLQRCLAVPS